MQLLKPEPDHSPTSVAKQYGSAKLQLSRHSACSLEKFANKYSYYRYCVCDFLSKDIP